LLIGCGIGGYLLSDWDSDKDETGSDVKSTVKVTILGTSTKEYVGERVIDLQTGWMEYPVDSGVGSHFFIVRFDVENIGDEPIEMSRNYVKISDTNGEIFSLHPTASSKLDGRFVSKTVQPKGSNMGELAFRLPDGATPEKLHYEDGVNNVAVDLESSPEEEDDSPISKETKAKIGIVVGTIIIIVVGIIIIMRKNRKKRGKESEELIGPSGIGYEVPESIERGVELPR